MVKRRYQKLKDTPAGLVFLDLKMPGMDGIEVLRRIKEEWPENPG
jgi:Response regulator containing a CheY-like receiver domain and an HTH DNA-binding domain